MKEKLNFNIDESFNKYFLKQFIFIFVNLTIFFLISYHYFPFIMSVFFMWLGVIVGILYLYLDIKFNSKTQKLEQRIDTLERAFSRRK